MSNTIDLPIIYLKSRLPGGVVFKDTTKSLLNCIKNPQIKEAVA